MVSDVNLHSYTTDLGEAVAITADALGEGGDDVDAAADIAAADEDAFTSNVILGEIDIGVSRKSKDDPIRLVIACAGSRFFNIGLDLVVIVDIPNKKSGTTMQFAIYMALVLPEGGIRFNIPEDTNLENKLNQVMEFFDGVDKLGFMYSTEEMGDVADLPDLARDTVAPLVMINKGFR